MVRQTTRQKRADDQTGILVVSGRQAPHLESSAMRCLGTTAHVQRSPPEAYESGVAKAGSGSRLDDYLDLENDAADAVAGICDAIDAIPAVTLAGHAIKAHVVGQWRYPYLWQDGDEEEGKEWRRHLRASTDALLALAQA
jgi:hypothetical protein